LLRVESPPQAASDEQRWQVTVLKTIAAESVGVEELRAQVERHRAWLVKSGEMAVREQLRVANTLENIIRVELNRRILARMPAGSLDAMVDAIRQRKTDPYTAAAELLEFI
jgi:LAO/AO transport system kinase